MIIKLSTLGVVKCGIILHCNFIYYNHECVHYINAISTEWIGPLHGLFYAFWTVPFQLQLQHLKDIMGLIYALLNFLVLDVFCGTCEHTKRDFYQL